MRKINVKNYMEMSGQRTCTEKGDFIYKPVVAPQSKDAYQCHIAFVEIDPGKQSFDYHYHETDEEAFYIIQGKGMVRTPNGEIEVRAGDVITFPAGPEYAHAIRNHSETEKLIYIDFDTHNLPEITHFPDTGKVEIQGPFSSKIYDEETGRQNANPRLKQGVRESIVYQGE